MSKQGSVRTKTLSLQLLCALVFFSCSHLPKSNEKATFQQLAFSEEGPVIGKTALGQDIRIGGFSGLQYIEELSSSDQIYFWTVTDRGPNGELVYSPELKSEVRPLLAPDFHPRIYKLLWDRKHSSLTIVDEIILKDSQGAPLTGLPNMERADEMPVDGKGEKLSYELMGIDPEGVAQDSEGNFWVSEEYRPSLLKFDSSGKLIKKFIPRSAYTRTDLQEIWHGHGRTKIIERFPEELNFRRKNRGFEGLSIKDNHLMISLQSPLRIPEAKNLTFVRFFDFDIKSEKVIATYVYPLSEKDVDKIGDISWRPEGLYVIEQNGEVGKKGVHNIYLVKDLVPFTALRPTTIPENMDNAAIDGMLLKKQLVIDLVNAGFDKHDKIEGIAILKDGRIAVSVDNDFGVVSKGAESPQQIHIDYSKKPVIAIFSK